MKNTIINALWRILGIAALSVIAPSAFAFGAFALGTDDDAADGMRRQTWGTSWNFPTQAEADARALAECPGRNGVEQGECRIVARFENAAIALVYGESFTIAVNGNTRTTTRLKNDKTYWRQTSNVPSVIGELLAECRREHTRCRADWGVPVDGLSHETVLGAPSSKSSGDSTGKRLAFVAGGAAVAGAVAWIFAGSGGIAADSSFSPVAEYSYDDGLRRYQVGTRLDWQNDKWSAYWKATKSSNIANNTDGFAFGSGAKWTGDIFSAAFNTSAIGNKSENNLSLSAEKIFGLWTLSPEYRLDYRTSESDKTLLHALSANAVWQGDKWTVRHSLGLSGESFAAFAKNATAKIQLRRDF